MNEDPEVSAYPLAWPVSWPRTKAPKRASFAAKVARNERREDGSSYSWISHQPRSLDKAQRELRLEVERLGAANLVISSNVVLNRDGSIRSGLREPADAGAAVYFLLDGARVLACDRWDRVADNLWAIKLHIESIRGQERWGVGSIEQAFSGYAALPERAGGTASHVELGLEAPATSVEEIEKAFRVMARLRHPDQGGSHEAFLRLQAARESELSRFAS